MRTGVTTSLGGKDRRAGESLMLPLRVHERFRKIVCDMGLMGLAGVCHAKEREHSKQK